MGILSANHPDRICLIHWIHRHQSKQLLHLQSIKTKLFEK